MYPYQGFVLILMGIVVFFLGLSCFDTKTEYEKKISHYDDWKKQGEVVVFQKDGESYNDAIRRFKCNPGVLVKQDESARFGTVVIEACDNGTKE